MATQNNNNRASLLAGLRTGGVRSSSLNVPHTAAPNASFNLSSVPQQLVPFPDAEEDDFGQFAQYPSQQFHQSRTHHPNTAAVDGPNHRFAQQQGNRPVNPNNLPFSPGFAPNMTPQAQMQMQMIQLEMLRIQALQNQQYQLAQAQQLQQIQQQQQQQLQIQSRERRTSTTMGVGYNPPATAGPTANTFDLRAATLSAQMRKANQADQLRSQLGVRNTQSDVPLTAALSGRFGSRSSSLNALAQVDDSIDTLPTSNSATTVISGGTSLGSPAPNHTSHNAPSKSDSVSSWRRGGNLPSNRAVSSPSVKVTPPTEDQTPPPLPTLGSPVSASGPKFRPQPLRFSSAVSQPLPTVAIDTTTDDDTDAETQSSGSSAKSGASNSSPTTPRSSSSNESPLSPREEASKRLFEGLGIGRPTSGTPPEHIGAQQQQQQAPTVSGNTGHRVVSLPVRQPRGPPSGADELGPKNFATRIRRQAIGGLGVLMGARERREVVEAY